MISKRSRKGPGWWLSTERKTRARWLLVLLRGFGSALRKKKIRQLKASHAMAIGQLQVETNANLDEMIEECDRLGHHLMLKDYFEEEVDAIKADTYVKEEDDEEAEAVGIVDGLDGVSRQTVLDNEGDDIELPKGGSEKVELDSSHSREDDVLMWDREFVEQFDRMKEVEEKDAKINKRLKELAEVTECAEKLQRRVDVLAVKGGSRTEVKTPLVQGDVVKFSGRIRKLESDVSRIQGHVQKGNTNLRECQHKLDTALIREKVLEGEIKAKESLVKRKEELLKDILARDELNPEIRRLRARVVDLEAMYLAESAKYTKKLEENIIYHAKVDAEMTEQKNEYARLESRLEKVRTKFAVMVISDASRFDQLKAIASYFVEEVK
ncbi:hypothetical protein GIB67_014198 [Kingdonia uniflora]|uniref:Uncharacterized protein n=1 Tax=Kingdonia uniflora TaxID=39325 RepID=A0A7J7M1U8_9MAGN|nr:hypothetical protein GIB67_014198 [Kingdonia uniflora]